MSFTSTVASVNVNISVTAPASQLLPYPSTVSTAGIQTQISFPLITTLGSSAGQANKRYVSQRTIPTSGSADSFQISTSGALLDELNNPVSFADVGMVLVYNPASASGGTLSLSSAASNGVGWAQLAGTQVITPGSVGVIVDAQTTMAVTAGSADALKVAVNTGSAVVYDIIIVGR